MSRTLILLLAFSLVLLSCRGELEDEDDESEAEEGETEAEGEAQEDRVQPVKKPRKSCSNSAQCPDSGTICKLPRPGSAHDTIESLDYADPVDEADAEDLGDVSEDPSQDPAFEESEASEESSEQSEANEAAEAENEAEADVESDEDNLKDFIDDAASTDDAIAVKSNVDVKSATDRRPIPPPVWPSVPVGQKLIVGHRPCVVKANDAPEMEAPQSDVNVQVTVNVHVVEVDKILAVGPLRCQVVPAKRRPPPVRPPPVRPPPPKGGGKGKCVCDSKKRKACRSKADCSRWGAGVRCVKSIACPIKGKMGYCRK